MLRGEKPPTDLLLIHPNYQVKGVGVLHNLTVIIMCTFYGSSAHSIPRPQWQNSGFYAGILWLEKDSKDYLLEKEKEKNCEYWLPPPRLTIGTIIINASDFPLLPISRACVCTYFRRCVESGINVSIIHHISHLF